jgi:polyisoprenoid-binding protein YceI
MFTICHCLRGLASSWSHNSFRRLRFARILRRMRMFVIGFALLACNKNPAEGQPQATVGEAIEIPSASASATAPATVSATAPATVAAVQPTVTASATAAPVAAANEDIALSGANTTIGFTGSRVGGSHEGSFKRFTGTLTLSPEKLEESKLSLDIETASVSTDAPKLTEHLKSPDFFDVAKFSKATFRSTSIKPSTAKGSTHTITGNLDFHGIRRSISFPANITVTPEKVSGTAQFSMNRKDFKVIFDGEADYAIKDYVLVKLGVNAARKK